MKFRIVAEIRARRQTEGEDGMDNNRNARRQKSFMQGRVFFDNRRSSADCLVRDVSEVGARLRFSGTLNLPDVFELFIPHKGETRLAKVQWRRGEEIGVAFEQLVEVPTLVPEIAHLNLEQRVERLEAEVTAMRRRFKAILAEIRPKAFKV
jgi:hypothetical protein